MNKNLINSIVIAIAIIITGYILSNAYMNKGQEIHKIKVTGLAEKDFSSNLAVWTGSFNKINADMKAAFRNLKEDVDKVKSFLSDYGFKENEISFSAVQIDKEYDYSYDNNDNRVSTFIGYRLTQTITVQSMNVIKVDEISRKISSLIDQGVEFYSDQPMFYYTQLADLKLELVEEATSDARARAEKIAENSGGRLGNLIFGDMGVFQITARYSNEDYHWGGAFNTTAIDKTASITMHLEFEVK